MEIIKSIKVELSEEFTVIAGCIYSIIAEDDLNFRKNAYHVLLDQMIDMNVDKNTLAIVLSIANAALTGESEEERNEKAKGVALEMFKNKMQSLSEDDNFDSAKKIIDKICSKIQISDDQASNSILEEVFDSLSNYPGAFSVIDGGLQTEDSNDQ